MVIKEYAGSLDIVDEAKVNKIKPKKDKLEEYIDAVNKNDKKEDSEKE